jgi:8-oxo-dGTP pyrophosphatase MutT (NUDIX family)
MKNFYQTHQVAVNAYIFRNGKFLLLKRKAVPCIWSPPGGRLKINENPIEGLRREVKEETNLDIEVFAPVNTWFGNWKAKPLLSIDYLVRIIGGNFKISGEHTDSVWVGLNDLKAGKPVKLKEDLGFTIKDFENAKRLSDLLY